MSGARMWEALAEVTGRAVRFPNIPLRLVAPSPEAAAKGLSVVTFITVPSTSKVRPRFGLSPREHARASSVRRPSPSSSIRGAPRVD